MMRIAIKNGKIILPARILSGHVLLVDDGKISDILPAEGLLGFEGQTIDAKGLYVSPGFVDIHTHGAGGADYMDGTKEAFITAATTHMRHGATCLFPTTLTCGRQDLYQTLDMFAQVHAEMKNGPDLWGLHLEGPYFSFSQRGAQDPRYLKNPDPDEYIEILERAGGLIKRWSIAPELPGALEMGRRLSKTGVVCSAGHTDATYEQMRQASENGFTHITHLYSGMSTIVRKLGYRTAGALEAGYLIDDMTFEIIADGKHLPASLLRFVCKCKPLDKVCLVTDSMRASGMPDGEYLLGSVRDGIPAFVEDGVAKLMDSSGFAGSVATPDQLIRTMLLNTDITLVQAIRMLTKNPSAVMGISSKKGSLEVGRDADIIFFNDDIHISFVMVRGNVAINGMAR